MTCDTISGHFVTDIGENANIGGGNNPDEVATRPGDSDGMAGAGGGAGQAPDVRHQPPGETSPKDY